MSPRLSPFRSLFSVHDSRSTVLGLRFAVFGSLLSVSPIPCFAQQEYVITIQTTLGDTTETFWLQIPENYQPDVPCPLLIGWHQWGGNHLEFKYQTDFDSIANARGWIAASHYGTSSTHWNNHATQSHVVDMIHWIEDTMSVDSSRIYMVGSSMGGAAGMIFSNNHLDPSGPMVSAAASMSGIQDCERRFYEQGINYTMIASFGGTPEEVPYEYHRNSAIYFADSTESMHFNAKHLPLYLTFGNAWSDSVWRVHSEDLYDVMIEFADTVVIYESSLSGHGWGACEEEPICDFFENFTLNRYPLDLTVNADEEGRWYWAEISMRDPAESFARFEGNVDTTGYFVNFTMLRNVASAALDLPPLGFNYDVDAFFCQWDILDGQPAQLSFEDVSSEPLEVRKDGEPYVFWSYDPDLQVLTLNGEGSGLYEVVLHSGTAPPVQLSPHRGPVLFARQGPSNMIAYELTIPGTVSWELFDVQGRCVRHLHLGWQSLGTGNMVIPEVLSSGIYFLKIEVAGVVSDQLVQRIVVVK